MTTVTVSSIVTIFEVGAVAKFDAATGDRLDCAHIELKPAFRAHEPKEVTPAEYDDGPDGGELLTEAVMEVPPGNSIVVNSEVFNDNEPRGHIGLSIEDEAIADFFEVGKRVRVDFAAVE